MSYKTSTNKFALSKSYFSSLRMILPIYLVTIFVFFRFFHRDLYELSFCFSNSLNICNIHGSTLIVPMTYCKIF